MAAQEDLSKEKEKIEEEEVLQIYSSLSLSLSYNLLFSLSFSHSLTHSLSLFSNTFHWLVQLLVGSILRHQLELKDAPLILHQVIH